jgi:hypothetical protein
MPQFALRKQGILPFLMDSFEWDFGIVFWGGDFHTASLPNAAFTSGAQLIERHPAVRKRQSRVMPGGLP